MNYYALANDTNELPVLHTFFPLYSSQEWQKWTQIGSDEPEIGLIWDILAYRAKIYWKLILKSLICCQSGTILAQICHPCNLKKYCFIFSLTVQTSAFLNTWKLTMSSLTFLVISVTSGSSRVVTYRATGALTRGRDLSVRCVERSSPGAANSPHTCSSDTQVGRSSNCDLNLT